MAGKKGRSGRRTKYDEELIRDVCFKGVRIVWSYLNDPNIKEKEKADYVRPFLLKHIPEKIWMKSEKEPEEKERTLDPEDLKIMLHNTRHLRKMMEDRAEMRESSKKADWREKGD